MPRGLIVFGNQSHIFGKSIAMSVKRIMYWANIELFKVTLELVFKGPWNFGHK